MGVRWMLSMADQAEISTGLKADWSDVRIAAYIRRDRSVVSREIARNSTAMRGYRSVHADRQAQQRRSGSQVRKVAGDAAVQAVPTPIWRQGRPPGAIAGRLRIDVADEGLEPTIGSSSMHGATVSHEAIYSYI